MKNPNVLSNSLHIYDQEYRMVCRNTYFSDYLVYLFEQFHTCNSNLSLYGLEPKVCGGVRPGNLPRKYTYLCCVTNIYEQSFVWMVPSRQTGM